jgi:midasin
MIGFQVKSKLVKWKDESVGFGDGGSGAMVMQGFLVEKGAFVYKGEPEVFHLTETFLEHLKDFLRAIAGTDLPVLLEGPTSAGKTSIIRYVASVTGHKCIRINNHEHT